MNDDNHVHRDDGAHDSLDRQHGAVWRSADQLKKIGRMGAGSAASDADVEDQRTFVDAAPDQPLDRLELRHVREHEMRLDAVRLAGA
jgi:hypothetical protein